MKEILNSILNNDEYSWLNSIEIAITVTDINDNIIYMNEQSKKIFGDNIIGNNLANCHSLKSVETINQLKNSNSTNSYTIEKKGIKKMIHQIPWYKNGEVVGLVEFSFQIPNEMPHHIRN